MTIRDQDKTFITIIVVLAVGSTALYFFGVPFYKKLFDDFGGNPTSSMKIVMSTWFFPLVLASVIAIEIITLKYATSNRAKTAIQVGVLVALLLSIGFFFYSTRTPLGQLDDEIGASVNPYSN